jgi:hypothetical protein
MSGCRVAVAWLVIGIVSFAAARPASASDELALGVAYDARAPVGTFRNVIPDVSYVGLQARWDYFPVDDLSIGVAIQYNHFRRERAGVEGPDSTTPATFRDVTFWSFIQTIRLYLTDGGDVRPYAELGGGISSAFGAVLGHDLTRRDAVTGFIMQPAFGLLVRTSDDDNVAARRRQFEDEDDPSAQLYRVGALRRPRESLFGVSLSVSCAYTTTDVGGATNVGYAGFQLGIYAKP